jgi:hypothetical protein
MASPALIAAALAALAPAGPQSPMMVAKKFSADYKKAMLTKDIAYFEKNSTADFQYIDTKGNKMAKGPAVEGVKMGFSMYKKYKHLDQKIVSARRAEGGVIMITDLDLEATVDMGGKVGNMTSKMRNESLLVPVGKGWAYKRIKVLTEDTKIDGKPLKM